MIIIGHIKLMLASGTHLSTLCSATCNAVNQYTLEARLNMSCAVTCLVWHATPSRALKKPCCRCKPCLKDREEDCADRLRLVTASNVMQELPRLCFWQCVAATAVLVILHAVLSCGTLNARQIKLENRHTAKLWRHAGVVMSRSACCGWTYSNIRRLPTCNKLTRISCDKQRALQSMQKSILHFAANAATRIAAVCKVSGQCSNREAQLLQHAQQHSCLNLMLVDDPSTRCCLAA